MRIAWISFDFSEYCAQQARALAVDHDVLLILAAAQDVGFSGADHAQTFEFMGFDRPRLREPLRQLCVMWKIVGSVRSFVPDVVHFQHGHLWFNFALPALRRFPLVVTIHDPRHHEGDDDSRKTPQAIMDFGFRRADRVIVHGRELIDVVNREIRIPKERIHFIPHVAIGEPPERPTVSEEANTVLFFGRIWEYKGLEYLIKAEPRISEVVPDVRITIAGRGESLDRYRRMMKNPGRFIVRDTWISDDERAELFQRTAVVVLPYVSATQSGVVPVAYAFGKPVIATEVGALPEAVDHGRTGLLVPPRDERALADAIVHLLQNRDLRRQMGENGRRKLIEGWSPERVVRDTVGVYELAIGDHKVACRRFRS